MYIGKMNKQQNNNKYPTIKEVAELCLKKFKTLPKTGKPTPTEWTVLAGIVQSNNNDGSNKVVALGCGTKCIGQSSLCDKGLILNDSHAEVLARRALLRYFYQQLRKARSKGTVDDAIFQWHEEEANFSLKNGISFHFLSTQTPCGDACIVNENDADYEVPLKKCKTMESANDVGNILLNDCDKVVYTGAKLLEVQQNQDRMQQVMGAMRTKPGKGDRTLSMSCSDKLAKWNVLGIQGALLDMLLQKPIYLETFNFCCNSNRAALVRAIYGRWQEFELQNIKNRFQALKPEIHISADIKYDFHVDADKQPSPNGLSWCDIAENLRPYEISVNGKRQGVTKKKLHTSQAALRISKYHLMHDCVDLLGSEEILLKRLNLKRADLEKINYYDLKQLSHAYQQGWAHARKTYFTQWTQKPKELQMFSLNTVNS